MEVVGIAQFLLACFIVLALLGAFALALKWWAKYRGIPLPGRASSKYLRVVERQPVDTQHSMAVLEYQQQRYVVLLSNQAAPLLLEKTSAPAGES